MRVAPPIRIPSRVMSDGGAFRDALKATSGGLNDSLNSCCRVSVGIAHV